MLLSGPIALTFVSLWNWCSLQPPGFLVQRMDLKNTKADISSLGADISSLDVILHTRVGAVLCFPLMYSANLVTDVTEVIINSSRLSYHCNDSLPHDQVADNARSSIFHQYFEKQNTLFDGLTWKRADVWVVLFRARGEGNYAWSGVGHGSHESIRPILCRLSRCNGGHIFPLKLRVIMRIKRKFSRSG